MGGGFVFPGGRLEAGDTGPLLSPLVDGLLPTDARRLLQEPDLFEAAAMGLFMTAIR